MNELEQLREQIDAVDRQLLPLFLERMELCRRVADYKRAAQMPVLDAKREAEVLANKLELLPDGEKERANEVYEFFRSIMAISRILQTRELGGEQDRIHMEKLLEEATVPKENPGVCYFGSEGSYSEEAAISCFGEGTGVKKDLILIGMPGCGKSTFGKKLAKEMGMPFLDLDEKIEETIGKTIPELFEEVGEDGFRRWETRVFAESVGDGRVIATGGGIVTRPENRGIAKGGRVIFIDRPLNSIMEDVRCDTRPLLAEGRERLKKLYYERIDLYRAWADLIIPNEGSFDKVLNQILNEVSDDEADGN